MEQQIMKETLPLLFVTLLASLMLQAIIKIIMVHIAVAMFEVTFAAPIWANMGVIAAKKL